MKTLKSQLTRKEAAHKIGSLIKNFYLSDSMDQSIGFNYDGEPDYDHNVYGAPDIAFEVYNTQNGFTLGDFDYECESEWTDDIIQETGDLLLGEWMPEDEDLCIVFKDEE